MDNIVDDYSWPAGKPAAPAAPHTHERPEEGEVHSDWGHPPDKAVCICEPKDEVTGQGGWEADCPVHGEPAPPAPTAFGEWEDEVMRIVKATESFDPENLEIYKAAATFAAEFAKYKLARAEQEVKTLRELVRQLHAAQPYGAHTHPPKETCLHCEIEAALAKGSE